MRVDFLLHLLNFMYNASFTLKLKLVIYESILFVALLIYHQVAKVTVSIWLLKEKAKLRLYHVSAQYCSFPGCRAISLVQVNPTNNNLSAWLHNHIPLEKWQNLDKLQRFLLFGIVKTSQLTMILVLELIFLYVISNICFSSFRNLEVIYMHKTEAAWKDQCRW